MPYTPIDFPRGAHDGAFPEGAAVDEQLRFMLNYAVLAPSVLNTQPWRYRVADGRVAIYGDPTRLLPALDPAGREMVISCGAAIMNLRLAVRHFGYHATFEIADERLDANLLAWVTPGPPAPPTRDEEVLFHAIARRKTERRPFTSMPAPEAVLRELARDVKSEGARLDIFAGDVEKAAIADLVGEAIRIQGRAAGAVADAAAWLRTDADPRPDGVRDEVQPEWGRHANARTPAEPVAVGTADLAAGSPALLVLSTKRDDRASWLAAGQGLERALLRATAHDLSASFLNQVTEVDETRARLADRIEGACPQVVFRIGHPTPQGGSLRRRVGDVVV